MSISMLLLRLLFYLMRSLSFKTINIFHLYMRNIMVIYIKYIDMILGHFYIFHDRVQTWEQLFI